MTAESKTEYADYDEMAWFYDKYWSRHYHPWALEVLERTVLGRLERGSAILDVCCGNGILAGHLIERGYRVVGLDLSRKMLSYARRHARGGAFFRGDIRSFELAGQFDAAMCTFDSINHMLSPAELQLAFQNVQKSLKAGASFIFDANLEAAYTSAWKEQCTIVGSDDACFVRGRYDRETRLASTELTMFRRCGSWRRSDLTLLQRYYPKEELCDALRAARFPDVFALDPSRDLGIEGHFSTGRAVFLAVKGSA